MIVSRPTVLGLALTVGSGALYALSGPIAKSLYAVGWSPGAVISMRLVVAALVLAPFTVMSLRGRWREVAENRRFILLYGVIMAGMQALFFAAMQYMSVTVALLLAMTAPLLIVLWEWMRSRRRPAAVTFLGIVVAAAGLVVILDPRGANLSGLGVVLGLGTAVCFAAYFVFSADQAVVVPPIALIGLGMTVAAFTTVVLNLIRVFPASWATEPARLAGKTMPWPVPFAMLVVCTVVAYVLGIFGVRYIGATVGSFVTLVEVPFTALFAWIILAEAITGPQLWGTVLILLGVAFVKWGDMRRTRTALAAGERSVASVGANV